MDLEIKRSNPLNNKILILFGILGFFSVYLFLNIEQKVDLNKLKIVTVVKDNMKYIMVSSGILEPKIKQWVSSPSSGIVTEIKYELGMEVKKTDVIIRLKNPQIFTELQSTQLALKIMESELMSEKYRLKNKKLDIESVVQALKSELKLSLEKYNAEEQLAKKGILSKIKLSQSKSKVEQLKLRLITANTRNEYFNATFNAQLEAKNAKIEDLVFKIKLRQIQYDNLDIKPSINGILQEINTEIGRKVSEGENVALIVQKYPLVAKIKVNQGSINKIQQGMVITINASGFDILGRVSSIAPQVEDGVVEVQVELPSVSNMKLKPQLSISALINTKSPKKVLLIQRPNKVVQGDNIFYVLSKDEKTAKRTIVEIGKITNEQVEIISGLNEGDKVIVEVSGNWNKSIKIE